MYTCVRVLVLYDADADPSHNRVDYFKRMNKTELFNFVGQCVLCGGKLLSLWGIFVVELNWLVV